MLNWFLQVNNVCFTEEEKEACKPIIAYIIDLVKMSRATGVESLVKELEQTQNLFLKTGVLLVTYGVEPSSIKHMLTNLILADNCSGKSLLEKLLITEGILALEQGENPKLVELRLLAMLGEKYLPS